MTTGAARADRDAHRSRARGQLEDAVNQADDALRAYASALKRRRKLAAKARAAHLALAAVWSAAVLLEPRDS